MEGNLAMIHEQESNMRSGRMRKHPTATCHNAPDKGAS
jgi:hypothetical protein